MAKRHRERFLPADHEWPELRDQYVTLIRAGYSAEEASKAITGKWFRNRTNQRGGVATLKSDAASVGSPTR
jgi:hypothetical protein